MISMSQAYSIRQLKKQGETVAEIARKVGVCRNTVYNCLAEDDLLPKMPAIKKRTKMLDPYRPLIIGWLEGDRSEWRKQRHTAHRIWARLTTEEGVEVGESCALTCERCARSSGIPTQTTTWTSAGRRARPRPTSARRTSPSAASSHSPRSYALKKSMSPAHRSCRNP